MLPSPLTILAAVIATFFVVLTVARGPVDADYWWHLTTGRLILEQGGVPTTDPFSFAYDGPWVAHEWLGEIVIAGLVDTLGYPVTAATFGVVTAASLLLPAWAVHREGVAVRALVPFVAIGTYGLASFATVRPQVLSWFLLAATLVLLMRLRPEHRIRPWLLAPLLLLWANVHGLWVVGLGVAGVYVIFTLVGRTPLRSRPWTAIGMFGAASAAAAVTPAGLDGLVYPLRYLRQDDWGTAFIAEWQPLDIADPRQWGVLLFMAAVVLLVRRRAAGWLAALAVLGLLGAVIAVRNLPLAMILALPMLAIALHGRLGTPARVGEDRVRRRRYLELGLAAIVVLTTLVVLPGAVDGGEEVAFPVVAFDALERERPGANTLVEYDWAGYAIHRLDHDGGQVFIDGRSDMYPRDIFEDYQVLRAADDGWEELMDRYGIEAVLLPSDAPLIEAASGQGWCPAHADERAVLLLGC